MNTGDNRARSEEYEEKMRGELIASAFLLERIENSTVTPQ